jgi:hypothetical protein
MTITYGSTAVEGPITGDYSASWLLVWTLDAAGSIYAMTRPTTVSKFSAGCSAYTYAQATAYRSGSWNEMMCTSLNHPEVKWIFKKTDSTNNATNIPIVLNTLLSGGNPGTYMTQNGIYYVDLNSASSVSTTGSNPYMFMHNNNGSEPGDIPTLGLSGTYVWSQGMIWGNIDAFSNYGGLLNTKTPWASAATGNTGDRLLVYIR